MALGVGERAPDFELANQFGERARLSSFAGGRPVALVFFPFAFSPTCTSELRVLNENLDIFAESGVELLAISVDPLASVRAWAEQEQFDFPLLSDFWPHGAVATKYDVLVDATGHAGRTTFVLDTSGTIRAAFSSAPGEPRTIQQYRDALAALSPSVP